MHAPWVFNRQPREEWPEWLREARVGAFHLPSGDGVHPEHLLIHNPHGNVTAFPGDTLEVSPAGIMVTKASVPGS